jgi:type II secretory pathway pseudopilin PulG
MRNLIDFSSWQGGLSTLLGFALVSLVAVGIRLLVMQTVQQRRERANRQINERLKTLIAAYKTLGGSFTGTLTVDPSHLRETRTAEGDHGSPEPAMTGSDRSRRLRDAVEAALSDVMLLGTPDQVRLAVQAANDMVAGRSVETAALVASLRTFVREVLGLDEVPADVSIPKQGPLRPAGVSARAGRGERADGTAAGRTGGQAGDGAGTGALGPSRGLGAGEEEPDGSARP